MEWFTMVAPAHSDIVPSRRFTLFPLFDCPASGRQLSLFGQPSVEFETGGIGHGGLFGDTGPPILVRHGGLGDMGRPFSGMAWSDFSPYFCSIERSLVRWFINLFDIFLHSLKNLTVIEKYQTKQSTGGKTYEH